MLLNRKNAQSCESWVPVEPQEKDQNYQITNKMYKVIIKQKDWVYNQW